jgi:hypothetical protein
MNKQKNELSSLADSIDKRMKGMESRYEGRVSALEGEERG